MLIKVKNPDLYRRLVAKYGNTFEGRTRAFFESQNP